VVQRYNSDLANDLGNLSSRTLTMINRYFNGSVPYPSPTVARKDADDVIKEHAQAVIAEFDQLFNDYQFSRALESAWSLIGAVNKYLVEQERGSWRRKKAKRTALAWRLSSIPRPRRCAL